MRVLIKVFDKSLHHCAHHVFNNCFVAALLRFKDSELLRFYNLPKKYY